MVATVTEQHGTIVEEGHWWRYTWNIVTFSRTYICLDCGYTFDVGDVPGKGDELCRAHDAEVHRPRDPVLEQEC